MFEFKMSCLCIEKEKTFIYELSCENEASRETFHLHILQPFSIIYSFPQSLDCIYICVERREKEEEKKVKIEKLCRLINHIFIIVLINHLNMKNAFSCFAPHFFEFTLSLCASVWPLKLHYDKLNYINNMNGCIKFIGFIVFRLPRKLLYPLMLSVCFQTTQQRRLDSHQRNNNSMK